MASSNKAVTDVFMQKYFATENVEWLEKAAEQGETSAQYMLGIFYCTGNGVPKDIDKGVKLIRKAAEQGDENAQLSLGGMYFSGEVVGVPKDLLKAAEWVRKAAAQGFAEAKKALPEVEAALKKEKVREEREAAEKRAQEEKEAAEKLRAAAEQGNADAQFNLGNSYFTGQGVTRDYAKAAEWFGKAAEQGHTEAKDLLVKAEREAKEKAEREAKEAKEKAELEAREAKEKAEREARRAKEIAERAAHEEKMRPLRKIGLFLQLGVTVAFFSIWFFSGFGNNYMATEVNGFWMSLFMMALPVGIPALVIGIISLIFRRKANSPWGVGLIILIDIVLSISSAIFEAKGFWGFIGYLILGLIVFSIAAIPGFIMTAQEAT